MASTTNGKTPARPDYKVERFGRYEVHQRLGIGGMATVHLALERGVEGFERWVALKRLLPHLGEDEEFVRSFVREAQLASLLTHPNVVQIGQLGKVEDQYFISMEYIEGRDVRTLLRHSRKVAGAAPLTVIASLLIELLDALDYAHRKADDNGRPLGLVHRDISPSNLLVSVTGHLKVIDFGIAKATADKSRSKSGQIKGKLAYISPEVLCGKQPDARSDLFSVGIIAHELLTARPLFASKNDYKTIQRIQNKEVKPPSTINAQCPAELDEWILKALAKKREERWSSAREMLDALESITRSYHLHATSRDVASWVEWAFSLTAPQKGRTSTAGRQKPKQRRKRTTPMGGAEEELVDIVWGTQGGSRAPLKLDEVAAHAAEPGFEFESDPSAVAPTALLFAVGDAVTDRVAADSAREKALSDEFESTEPSGLVGRGDASLHGTIDLSEDDWLIDSPGLLDEMESGFAAQSLTALSQPLGRVDELPTSPRTAMQKAKGTPANTLIAQDGAMAHAADERFDGTEPEANLVAKHLPKPLTERPASLEVTSPSTENRKTALRPAVRARGSIAGDVGDDEPTLPPKVAQVGDDDPTLRPKLSKPTTLKGVPTQKPPANPVDVVLLDKPTRRGRKRVTVKRTVPPLPAREDSSVTLSRDDPIVSSELELEQREELARLARSEDSLFDELEVPSELAALAGPLPVGTDPIGIAIDACAEPELHESQEVRLTSDMAPEAYVEPMSARVARYLIGMAAVALVAFLAIHLITRGSGSASQPASAELAAAATGPASPAVASHDASSVPNEATTSTASKTAPNPKQPEDTFIRPTKISGDHMRIRGDEHPAVVRARVCVGRRGRVQSVRTLGAVSAEVSRLVTKALSKWRYEPYRQNHKPVVACFEENIGID